MAATVLRPSFILHRGTQLLQAPIPSVARKTTISPTFTRPLAFNSSRCQFHVTALRGEKQSTKRGSTTDVHPPGAPKAEVLLPIPPSSWSGAPPFAFAFDMDGVLIHSTLPYPPAIPTLRHLQHNSIPFLLLTNGGGRTEKDRAQSLSEILSLHPPLSETHIIQSHTPFILIAKAQKLPASYDPYVAGGRELKNSVLIVGGSEDRLCSNVAKEYGFKNVVIPQDILLECSTSEKRGESSVWPFRRITRRMEGYGAPLPRLPNGKVMPIDAIFVFNDPIDWGINIQIILDLIIPGLDGVDAAGNPPPPLIFSNPDLLWAANHPTPRLGQGAFRAALEGTYRRVVEATRPDLDPQMKYVCIGKPSDETYRFAEDRLQVLAAGAETVGAETIRAEGQLKRVYMVGDNPLSDIQGANTFQSPRGVEWVSVLVKTGVYKPGQPLPPGVEPKVVVDDVLEGVKWALEREGWQTRHSDVESGEINVHTSL